MNDNRLKHESTPTFCTDDCHSKTFIIGCDKGRPRLFTPARYDLTTGLLHGVTQGGQPMSLALSRFLVPYEPSRLEWEDELAVQELELK